MKTSLSRFCIPAALLMVSHFAVGQVSTGIQPMGSFAGGPDVINLGNLNVHLAVPVVSKAGRGTPFIYSLGYESSVWYPVGSSGTQNWQPAANWGWRGQTDAAVGFVSYTASTGTCFADDHTWQNYTVYIFNVYVDEFGAPHNIGAQTNTKDEANCIGGVGRSQTTATDPSGLTFILTNDPAATVVKRDGTTIHPPLAVGAYPATLTDKNGNQITTNGSNFTDTLGSTALSISGSAPNPKIFTYTDSTGTPQSVTANYSTYTVQTNFGCNGISEYGPTSASLVSSVVLPDGSSYSVAYEQTPGGPTGNITGRVSSITLPSSGTITYSYSGGNHGISCPDGSTAGLTRITADGTTTFARSGSGTTWTTTVTDAQTNQTVISFQTAEPVGGTAANFYETQRDIYTGGVSPSNLLLTTYTCYNGTAYPCASTAVSLPLNEIAVTTNLNGFYRKNDTTLNSLGLPLVLKEYDYGPGSPGGLLRETDLTYATINGTNVVQTDVVVKDGSNNKVAETKIAYDGSALTATSGVTQHDYTNYSSAFTARGDATSVSQWVAGTTFNVATNTYDDLGNLRTTTDPGGHQTTFDYTDSYSDGLNHNTQAFVTTVTLPATASGGPTQAHIFKSSYYWPAAMLDQATDQNNQVTTYTYDSMWRPLTVSFPDAGQISYQYLTASQSAWGGPTIVVQSQIDATQGNTTSDYTLADGYGRLSRRAIYNGGEAGGSFDQVDTCYNSLGQAAFISYPYQGNGFTNQAKRCGPSAGDSFAYDSLGRLTSRTHSDGSSSATTYFGRAIEVQDEGNGLGTHVSHVYQQDALGRTVTACELAGGIFGITTMPTCGLDLAGTATGVTTSYSYDPLGNVTQIVQGGLTTGPTRQMTYDGLSHLLTEKIPEAGGTTTSYVYNSDGLLASRTRPSANQAATCIAQGNCTMTTTNYSYDNLHRIVITSYADTASENTLPVVNLYDAAQTGAYNVGRLTNPHVEDKGFTVSYHWINLAYDAMGRVTDDQQSFHDGTIWHTYDVAHTYNRLGLPATSTDGAGHTLNYSYNRGGRLTQLTSNPNDTNHPGTLFSAAHYNAGGQIVSDSLGNGATEAFNFDARLRPLSLSAVKNTTTLYNLGGPGTGSSMVYAPNSGLTAASDSANGNWTYTYDALNRIASAAILAQTQVATDSFSGSSLSANWTVTEGSFAVASNTVAWGTGGTDHSAVAAWNANSFSNDQYSQITVAANNNTGGEIRVVVRASLSALTYYGIAIDGNSHDVFLFKVVSGTATVLEHTTYTLNLNDLVRLSAIGSSLFVTVNGQVIASATDSSISGGRPGIGGYGPPPVGPTTQQKGASWSAGNAGTNLTFDIDANANRWHQNPAGQGAQASFDSTTNRINNLNVVYDAVGNIINDGVGHTYTYDAEGRITQVDGGNTASYFYDALGRRARRTVSGGGYEDAFDGINMVAESLTTNGSWVRGEVYGPTAHLATYNNGTTYFSHKDWLGSERVRSDVNGNSVGTCTGNPYGDNYTCSGTDPSPIKYAGMEYDSETQLYHTLFRYLNPRLGVWMSPDPAGLAGLNPGDPQSSNRYAYVENGPTNFIDPIGLKKQKICLLDDSGNDTNFCVGINDFLDDPFSRGPGATLGSFGLVYVPGIGYVFPRSGGSLSGFDDTLENLLAEFVHIDTCPAGTFECPVGGAPLFGEPGCHGPWCVNDSGVVPNVGIPLAAVGPIGPFGKTAWDCFNFFQTPSYCAYGCGLRPDGSASVGYALLTPPKSRIFEACGYNGCPPYLEVRTMGPSISTMPGSRNYSISGCGPYTVQ